MRVAEISSAAAQVADSPQNWRMAVSLVLILASALGLAALSHGSPVPPRNGLDKFPEAFGSWKGVDIPVDQETRKVLGATDLLNRAYLNVQDQSAAGFFIGFFASQRKGGAIHSPRNCLPGAGWEIAKGGVGSLTVPGNPAPLLINQYVIEKGLEKQVVLYWYQTQGRVIASEYWAKFYLIWDALTRNRTDGALVRIIVPIHNEDEGSAVARAKIFAQAIFPRLSEYIPN